MAIRTLLKKSGTRCQTREFKYCLQPLKLSGNDTVRQFEMLSERTWWKRGQQSMINVFKSYMDKNTHILLLNKIKKTILQLHYNAKTLSVLFFYTLDITYL